MLNIATTPSSSRATSLIASKSLARRYRSSAQSFATYSLRPAITSCGFVIQKSIRLINLIKSCDSAKRARCSYKTNSPDDLWIVPLYSWYDGVYNPEMKAWADFHLCKWPNNVQSLP